MVLYFFGRGGGTKESIKALRVKIRVIRLITGVKRFESCRQQFKENKIITVTSIYVLEVLCFINKQKGDLKKIVKFISITRETNMTFTKSRNTSLLQKSVLHMGARLYKHLPLRIKKLDNCNQFRKEVKSILLNNTFYTLEEYLQAVLE